MAEQTSIDPAVEDRVMRIINTAVYEVGGPGELIARGEHEMLPVLLTAAYALVLHDEKHQSLDAIAAALNTTPGAVQAVFEAPMEAYAARLRDRELELPEFQRHEDPAWSGRPTSSRTDPAYLAGALAKFAYAVVKRGGSGAH